MAAAAVGAAAGPSRGSGATVEAGGQPLHRAVSLIHGAFAEQAMANSARALREHRAVPIEIVCRKAPQ